MESNNNKLKKKSIIIAYNEEDEDQEEEEFKIKSVYDLNKQESNDIDNNTNEIKQLDNTNIEHKEEKEEEKEEVLEEEEEDEEQVLFPKIINRDPSIDSDYDSDLDLNNSESISINQLKAHKYLG